MREGLRTVMRYVPGRSRLPAVGARLGAGAGAVGAGELGRGAADGAGRGFGAVLVTCGAAGTAGTVGCCTVGGSTAGAVGAGAGTDGTFTGGGGTGAGGGGGS